MPASLVSTSLSLVAPLVTQLPANMLRKAVEDGLMWELEDSVLALECCQLTV